MSVHTLGNTTPPSAGANDTASYNEIGATGGPGMPSNGYITDLYGYFGATSGTMSANLLLFNGNTLEVTAGAQTVGGQTWQHASITPYYMAAGSSPRVGWFVSGEVHFSVYGSGTWQAESVGSPSNLNGNVPGSPYFQGGTGYYTQWIDPLSASLSVSPASASAGQSVTITGSGFQGGSISSVTFNGIAASFSVVNDNTITATVPGGFTSGTLAVNSDHGTGTTTFTEASPVVTGVSPSAAGVGQSVTISGSNFANGSVTSVTFNGTAAATYSVVNDSTITATVPAGATSGPLTVNTNHGSASTSFTVSSAYAYDGSAFQVSTVESYDGANWQICQVFIYDGSNWQSSE